MCIKKIKHWIKKKDNQHQSSHISRVSVEQFVEATIIGIMSGIRGAQKKYQESNSAFAPLVCPAWGPPLTNELGIGTKGHADKMYDLEFDVAVTIDESASLQSKGSVGITVAGLKIGTFDATTEFMGNQSTISRIRFKIPVRYPLAKLAKADFDALPND